MKTVKQSISSTSFITSFWRLTLNRLQKKEAVKRLTLISFVLLCILIRSVMLSADKNLEKQNKQATFSAENLNLPVWPARLIFRSKIEKKQLDDQLKMQDARFNRSKKSLNLYTEN